MKRVVVLAILSFSLLSSAAEAKGRLLLYHSARWYSTPIRISFDYTGVGNGVQNTETTKPLFIKGFVVLAERVS